MGIGKKVTVPEVHADGSNRSEDRWQLTSNRVKKNIKISLREGTLINLFVKEIFLFLWI